MEKSWKINKFKSNSAFREAVIIVVATVIVTILTVVFGLFHIFFEWTTAYGELHELIIGFIFLCLSLCIYSFRRYEELKREISLRVRSEKKYHNLTESLNDLIYCADPETLVSTYVNQAVERIYGYTVEEWFNVPDLWGKSIYPDDRERVFAEFTELQTKLESGIVEYRIIKKDKTIRWVQDHISWEKDQQGKVVSINGVMYDITERKRVERDLRESEEKFRTIFESANDAIYLTNLNGQFLEVNQVACDQLGYSRSELLQMGPKDIDSFHEVAQVENRINQMLQDGYVMFETAYVRKDGSTIPVEVNIRLIDCMRENVILGISRDITKHKQAETMLREKAEAEAANISKSKFLANMSHELRTPLNAIIGFSDMLLLETFGTLNDKQTKYVNNITSSGKHLLDLINDILDLSKVEAGKMELHPEEFDVSSAIGEVNTLVASIAEKKRIDISTDLADNTIVVEADKTKFKQILYNLLSNSLKFTPDNGTIGVSANIKDELLYVSVKDSGMGIAKEDIGAIFSPFKQLEEMTSKVQPGTGLGLALIKTFVEMHGGDIWVDSEVGKGSTFTFAIPTDFENISF